MATDPREFAALAAPHVPMLGRLGFRLTRQRADSDDLVQEALTRALVGWKRLERPVSMGAWLGRILVHVFISNRRHAEVVRAAPADEIARALLPERECPRDPEELLAERLLADHLRAALLTLPAPYRDVTVLVDLDGLTYRAAARHLGVPIGTVMSRIHRARSRLREVLAPALMP